MIRVSIRTQVGEEVRHQEVCFTQLEWTLDPTHLTQRITEVIDRQAKAAEEAIAQQQLALKLRDGGREG